MSAKKLIFLYFLLTTTVLALAQAPVVTNLNPTHGVPGTIITLTGTAFSNAQKLTIGENAAIILSNTDTQLTAMVMPGTTGGNVAITTSGGTTMAAYTFTLGSLFYPTQTTGRLTHVTNPEEVLKQSYSVAINADGSTAIVGNPVNSGDAFIYTRTKQTWQQQGNRLTIASDDGSPTNFGNAVGLSADGNIAIVGAPNDNQKKGALWVFVRNNNTWQQPGIKLEGTGGNTTGAFMGRTAAISADGKTIVAGGFSAGSKNAIWIFTQSGNQWQQTAMVEAPDGGKSSKDYQPIALSADGNTVALKGLNGSYVFYHNANGWVAQGGRIFGSDQPMSVEGALFEIAALALNSDGNTLISSGLENRSYSGAWVFERSAGQWVQQAKLAPARVSIYVSSRFGTSVSLSADGKTAMIGMPGYRSETFSAPYGGGVMCFTRSGNKWSESGILYGINRVTPGPPSDDPGPPILVDKVNYRQGFTSAISADGRVAIAGGVTDDSDGGQPWIFGDYVRHSQRITFTQPGPVTYGVPDFDPAVSTNKGAPLSYKVISGPATIVNGKLHITGAGIVHVSASQVNGNEIDPAYSVGADITVKKALLTIKPDDKVRIFDQVDPPFTVRIEGFVNGDTQNSIANLKVSTAAQVRSPPGVYNINASANNSTNYDFTFLKGKLTVLPQPIALAIKSNYIYGQADFSPNVTSLNTTQPIILTSSDTKVATIVDNMIHIVGAGTFQLAASQATDGYFPAYTAKQYIIVTKASLIIRANNVSMYVGDAIPTLTARYAGFINDDSSADFLSPVKISTTAPAAPGAGEYDITLSDAVSNNYNITYVSGKLTVTNAIPIVTSFSPATAIEGTVVTITGDYLDRVTAVKFGDSNAASFTAVSKTTLQAVVGKGASGAISVVAPGGTATLPGFTFMYTLPQSNFKLTTTGASCNGSTNGNINITAAQALNYTATISGNSLNSSYNFTSTTTIGNLAAGAYSICITINGQPDYRQCYDVVITEPKNLSVYAEVNPNHDQVSLALSGGINYTIKLNGVQYNTTKASINLPLSVGDNELEVTTDMVCQGTFKKNFNVDSRIIPYPNPFQNALKLNLGDKNIGAVIVEIYDLTRGKSVYLKQYANQSGILTLDLGEQKNGVYSLKLVRDGQQSIYKIIKQ